MVLHKSLFLGCYDATRGVHTRPGVGRQAEGAAHGVAVVGGHERGDPQQPRVAHPVALAIGHKAPYTQRENVAFVKVVKKSEEPKK